MHPNAQKVTEALRAAGATGTVRELSDSARTAALAAQALGCEVGAIANSLVFRANEEAVLVLTSGAHRVDTGKVAALLEVPALRRADPELVYAATGQRIGGVAPVGHPAPLRAVVDVALAQYPQIWASAGTPYAVFPTTYEELLRLTSGVPAEVA